MTADAAAFRLFHYRSFDNLRLAARIYDAPAGALPLVCLPGLTRTARDFHELALRVVGGPQHPRRVIAFDYRGRGESAWDPSPANYSVLTEMRDVFDGLAALEVKLAIFFGTSRGGLITMIANAVQPDAIAASVLNDIGPVLEAEGLDDIRRYVGKTPDPPDWPGAVESLKRLHGQRFSALTETDWEAWARTTFADRNGRPAVDYDPALAMTLAPPPPPPEGTPPPDLWPQFRALAAKPMLVLRGVNSPLLGEATAAAMAAANANVKLETVAGQGHPVQLRGAVNETVATFLAALPE